MSHRFYQKSKKERRVIQFKIAFLVLLFNLAVVFISFLTGLYLLSIFGFALSLSIVAPFFDTPALVSSGKLNYYSPLFLAEKERNGVVKIHGGTLFDYFFVIDRKWSGKQRTSFILHQYLEGLLNLIQSYEEKGQTVKIEGTSYLLNKRTAKKLGFKLVKTNLIQLAILAFNYFNLLISISFAKDRLSFPALIRVKTMEADLELLATNKEYIADLNRKIRRSFKNDEKLK